MKIFKDEIVYISGPMTGLPDYNRTAFFAAEKWLKEQGAIVLNPAYSPDGLPSHEAYMTIALAMLRVAQFVFLLPNYRNSKGVAMELELAKEMGIPICHASDHAVPGVTVETPPDPRVTAPALLGMAANHMSNRAATYDKPEGERSMLQTVTIFNQFHGTRLTEAQGWHFQQVLKDVRLFTRKGYHADSAEDCIAYAALKAEAKAAEA